MAFFYTTNTARRRVFIKGRGPNGESSAKKICRNRGFSSFFVFFSVFSFREGIQGVFWSFWGSKGFGMGAEEIAIRDRELEGSLAQKILSLVSQKDAGKEEQGGPHPHTCSLKKKVLLRADLVLTKGPESSYEGNSCGKIDREGSCSKPAGGL